MSTNLVNVQAPDGTVTVVDYDLCGECPAGKCDRCELCEEFAEFERQSRAAIAERDSEVRRTR